MRTLTLREFNIIYMEKLYYSITYGKIPTMKELLMHYGSNTTLDELLEGKLSAGTIRNSTKGKRAFRDVERCVCSRESAKE